MASLSALGAGALALGTGTAEAGVIYSAVNVQVGFGSTSVASYGSLGLGIAAAGFNFRTHTAFAGSSVRAILGYGNGLQLAATGSLLRVFNAGAIWNPGFFATSFVPVGGRIWGSSLGVTFAFPFGNSPFTDRYALFKFQNGPNTDYGWIQLSYSVNAQFGPGSALGPDLRITAYAYDDAGNALAAGSTAAVNMPEPATVFSTGLAALALGASGLRRWRKTRNAA